MKTKAIMTICLLLLMVEKASAQWSVINPTNIAQSIINSSNNIVHTSLTATTSRRDREDLRAGQEVLRCAEVGEQPCQGHGQGLSR